MSDTTQAEGNPNQQKQMQSNPGKPAGVEGKGNPSGTGSGLPTEGPFPSRIGSNVEKAEPVAPGNSGGMSSEG